MGQSQEATSNTMDLFPAQLLAQPVSETKITSPVLPKTEKHISVFKTDTTLSPLPSHTDGQYHQCKNSTSNQSTQPAGPPALLGRMLLSAHAGPGDCAPAWPVQSSLITVSSFFHFKLKSQLKLYCTKKPSVVDFFQLQ